MCILQVSHFFLACGPITAIFSYRGKALVGFVNWQVPFLENLLIAKEFFRSKVVKSLKSKNKGQTNFYECCDLTKKVYLTKTYTRGKNEFWMIFKTESILSSINLLFPKSEPPPVMIHEEFARCLLLYPRQQIFRKVSRHHRVSSSS